MRVAVTGTTGRVGAALARHLATNHEVIPLPRRICDLADRGSLASALDRLECDVLINPAGLTGLEACEDDPELAMRVNAEAPAEMASWAEKNEVRFFHFSTDYVFGGEMPGLRREDDIPSPLSVYGRSKLGGENAVLAFPENCVIRVSWVFGPEKPSFIDQIFTTALAGNPLAAVTDKFSFPTFTGDLATWMDSLISRKCSGILHACNPGEPVSWHGMAMAVVEEMVASGTLDSVPEIAPLRLEDVKAFRAARPRFTAMDPSRLASLLDAAPRSWKEAVTAYVRSRCVSR
ncbi:MAG: NAD(P)-dependent oxidoreductase [Luteolibacter sp.]